MYVCVYIRLPISYYDTTIERINYNNIRRLYMYILLNCCTVYTYNTTIKSDFPVLQRIKPGLLMLNIT